MTVSVVRLVGIVMAVTLAAFSAGRADDRQAAAAPQRGEVLLMASCTVSHSTDLITQQRFDRTRWHATIAKMVRWGAAVSDEEAAMLADYLSARYHPGAPDEESAGERGAVEPAR